MAQRVLRANPKRRPAKSLTVDDSLFPDSAVLARLRRALLRWYRTHARDLPWRSSRDAYRVWISEIMLQQTTVVAVVPYFERFTARFPTVYKLAEASEHEVLRYWEGLGYYSRARHLRATAQRLVADHSGQLPHEVAELMQLPGIGRYTAGAIASLAYDRPAPIVEANTLRVYSRLIAFRGDPHSSLGRELIWKFAEQAVPKRSAGAFNQALMDLGATVCTPSEPKCPECPIRSCCQAFREGVQREIPVARSRRDTTYVTEAMVAVRKRGSYLLWKRPQGERWAGLWEFLRIALDEDGSTSGANGDRRSAKKSTAERVLSIPTRRQIEQAVGELTGLKVETNEHAFDFHHTVTRFRIRLICATANCRGGKLRMVQQFRWTSPDDFANHAFSMPARKFADRLSSQR